MAQHKFLAPPELVPEKYRTWKKEMLVWEMATAVSEEKRGPTVFLSLSGKAREAVLEMDLNKLNTKEGLKLLYEKLDSLFEVDKHQAALMAYGDFEKYTRPSSMTIADFNVEFDRMVQQLKDHEIKLPKAVLAYRVLKSANLGEGNEKLVLATVKDTTCKEMMGQIRKVMGIRPETLFNTSIPAVAHIKSEPAGVNLSQTLEDPSDQAEEILYNTGYQRGYRGRGWRGNSYRGGRYSRGRYSKSREETKSKDDKKHNPLGHDGKPSKCAICGSTMHWAKNCQHSEKDEDSVFEANIVLMSQSRSGKNTLLGQTLGATVLDSGCSRSVCGKTWYNCYLETLPDKIRDAIKVTDSKATFQFGNGEDLKSMFKVNIPCTLAGKKIEICTDVVESDIPLLLSKHSMKKSNTVLDFEKDSVSMFGEKLQLQCTDSGHYYIPLSRPDDIVRLPLCFLQ